MRRRKQACGARVCAIVPARDERATVAAVVHGLARAGDLLDDLVVVDSDSTDGTAEVAAAAGARVVRQDDVLPEAGPGAGKGEALWKGLAATSGDLVLVVDADLRGVDERYAAALLGPLLADPDLVLVKAATDRSAGAGDDADGGRVTELLARPALAAWWPELAGIVQPLAGEFAARRDALEAVPTVQGYGVDIALLIDLARAFGADRIAQVDLGVRVHRRRSLTELGRMAAEILATVVARLEADHGARLPPPRPVLPQPTRDERGRLVLEPWKVERTERPPLASFRAATVDPGRP